MTNPSIPGVPFDPRRVGPVDILANWSTRLQTWASEHTRELLAVGTVILLAQIAVYAHSGVVFLRPPKIPAWVLVMIGTIVFFAPIAALTGILLGKGLYRDDTILVKELSAISGDERIRHVAPERWSNAVIVNQNGERRQRDYLQQVMVNGREAWEVDCYDVEGNRVVASSMAGRTNKEVRQDRRAIKQIKTDQEREVDEAIEFKINFRDIVRERSAKVANWIIRTSQEGTLPNGGELFDELQGTLDDVDPYEDLHSPGDAETEQDDEDDVEEVSTDATSEATLDEEDGGILDIFERSARNGSGGASSDD